MLPLALFFAMVGGTDYVNSKFILMWGWSPADGTFGTNTREYLEDAKHLVAHRVRALIQHRLRRTGEHQREGLRAGRPRSCFQGGHVRQQERDVAVCGRK